MKVNFALIGILILACLMITPVMAETLTGDLGGTGWNSTNYIFTTTHYTGWPGAVSPLQPTHLFINDFEYSGNFKSMIWFNTLSCDGAGAGVNSFDAGALAGAQTPVTFRMTDINGGIVGTGRIGYQRFFNQAVPPVEILGGYFYVEADSWNLSTYSGDQSIFLDYNHSLVYNMSFRANNGNIDSPPIGKGSFRVAGAQAGGAYTWNKDTNIWASYTATKPLGLGIQGVVNKTQTGGSIPYNSRAYILNSTGSVITSDTTSNPTPFFFNVPNEQVIIAILAPDLSWYNSTLLFNVTGSVTPTPTPIAGAIYTISTSTDFVNVSGTNTVTISSVTDPSLADLKFIHYGYSDSTNIDTSFYEVGSTIHASSYSKIGGQWTGYNSQSVEYDNVIGAVPSPYTLKWDTTNGTKTLVVTLQNSAGDYTYLTRTITVGQGAQNLIETKAQAMDGTNGGQLGMVSMQIYNHNTGVWTNLSPNDGLGKILTPANTILSYYVQKAGFTSGTLMNQPARADITYQVPLFIGPSVGAGFVNYFVTVQDANGYPLGGAAIAITPASGATKYATSSSNGGSQIFNLTNSTLHTYTVSKQGYQTRSGSFTTSNTAGTLTVQLSPLVTPTKTYVIPTGSWTVSPTYAASNTTFWEPWKRVFGMMGANSTELPILIAGLVIILCMAAGAGMAGVLGAEVAMGFGAILCVALGLIPIWVVLAIIILGFLFYGLKVGR